ncbi:CYTH domain-containing protein [Leptothoe kymatousa]|uniref:CYTH domain-containing protein n=1 Tax=Leptothoe kymatousa TAU-MAC 1615 TaxID=2364775 RepID=A0ABS5Y2V1_9CYAN|nr:CYTH domain-containing protein [Leptothoe kymatousa]MBT9312168.1 CYTH domain-containing protein [Leptothoe kymatousa TAU-MAC 1615]
MAKEIERKFLVQGDAWRSLATGRYYCQGYIPTQGKQTVRVRIIGEQGYLTLKGPTVGISRSEFEYPIPLADAQAMLAELCEQPFIEKYRYRIPMGEFVWEIDEFSGENQGLLLAEVELTDPEQVVELPSWIGQEVTGDPRYYNSNLVTQPFKTWSMADGAEKQ